MLNAVPSFATGAAFVARLAPRGSRKRNLARAKPVDPDGALVVAVVVALVIGRASDAPTSNPAPAAVTSSPHPLAVPSVSSNRAPARGREQFVGSAICASCHQAQSEAYSGSHHAKALVVPTPEMAKARFDGSHFSSKLGGATNFSLHDGAPFVSTAVAGGKTATFPIRYISGVWPLEQYVVASERGKLQSLGVVWDSRTAAEGGGKMVSRLRSERDRC